MRNVIVDDALDNGLRNPYRAVRAGSALRSLLAGPHRRVAAMQHRGWQNHRTDLFARAARRSKTVASAKTSGAESPRIIIVS